MSDKEGWEYAAFSDGALAYDLMPEKLKAAVDLPQPLPREVGGKGEG